MATRIDDYELVSEIGRGATGVVWRARQVSTGREVALKHLLAGEADRDQRRRFEREALALAKLRHPNVVSVHAVGDHGGRPYLVMDLVQGESLQAALARGPLPLIDAVRIATQVAEALDHAHRHGVVHRDVKPDNVVLDAAGAAKLTDFGLARDLQATGTRLSATGRFLGTPGYWPPEQAAGRVDAIGPPSDVYALGATLWALLVGHPPFEGGLIDLVIAAESQPPEPPSALRPEVDRALDAVCLHCMAKAPDDRYPSAAALVADLRAYAARGEAPTAAEALRWRSARRQARGLKRVALVAPPLLLAAGLLAWAATTPGLPAAPSPAPPPGPAPSPSPEAPVAPTPPSVAPPPLTQAQRGALELARRKAKAGATEEAVEQLEYVLGGLPPDHPERIDLESELAALFARQAQGAIINGLDYPRAVGLFERAHTLAPSAKTLDDLVLTFVAWGDGLRGDGKTKEAIARYQQAAALDLDRALPWLREADLLRTRYRHADALPAYDAALEREPENALALADRGDCFLITGDRERALSDLDRSLELEPNNPMALANRSHVHWLNGAFAQADADATRAYNAAPDHTKAMLAYVHARVATGRANEVDALSARLVEHDPEQVAYVLARASVLTGTKRHRDAQALLHRLRQAKKADSSEYHYVRAHVTYGAYDHQTSLKHSAEAIARGYRPVESRLLRARTLRRLASEDPRRYAPLFFQQCDEVVGLAPDRVEPFLYLAEYLCAWKGYFNPAESRKAARRALQLEPNNVRAHELICAAWGRDPDATEEALVDADALVRLAPDNHNGHRARADYFMHVGRYAEALEATERALELRPKDSFLHYRLGTALRGLKRHDEALVALKRAHGLAPANTQVALTYGECLSDLGRHGEALAILDRFVDADTTQDVRYARGKVRLRTGDKAGAIADLEAVLEDQHRRREPRHPPAEVRAHLAEARALE
jgi:tetratricopeptide (TPR) repeat protein